MAVKIEKFNVTSKGFNDVIDITNKIESIISFSDVPQALITVSTDNCFSSVLLVENYTNQIDLINSLTELKFDYKNKQNFNETKALNQLKSLIAGRYYIGAIDNHKLKLLSNQKILLLDFEQKPSTKEIYVTFNY